MRQWVTGTVQRLIAYGLDVYSGRGGAIPVDITYSMEKAIEAPRRNPWVYVCVQAVATDLASLPIVALKGEEPNEEIVADHWLPKLLQKPHPKTPGRKLRKQLYADLRVTGNAYVRVWRDAQGKPFQLARICPDLCKAIVTDDGEIVGWQIGTREPIPYDDVLHMADFSLDYARPEAVYGASPIEPLRLALQVDYDARKQAGRAARRGRLEAIVSPKSDSVILSDEKVQAVVKNYDAAVEDGNGMFFLNQGVEVETISYTPRDGEFLEQGKATKAEIMAVFGVPGTRAGDSGANYGTSKQQMRGYWETLVAFASIIDEELSRLAGEEGIKIRHQFTRVEALQSAYTERQLRAEKWAITFGMEPKVAARYEGFLDAPVPDGPLPDTATGAGAKAPSQGNSNSDKVDQPREQKAALVSAVRAELTLARDIFAEDPAVGQRVLRSRLITVLKHFGVSHAEVLADEVAGVCYTAVEADDGIDLDAVFGAPHAKRIGDFT